MPGVCTVGSVSSNTGCAVYYACLSGLSCLAESESSNTGCAIYYACLSERSCLTNSERSTVFVCVCGGCSESVPDVLLQAGRTDAM